MSSLSAWPNVSLTIACLLLQAHLGVKRGRTIVGAFSLRADAAVVEVLRRRWPLAPPEEGADGSL